MIYEIRAGGQVFITMVTDSLGANGIYYGTSNLPVRSTFDYYSGFLNTYIYPGTRTVYVPGSGGGNAQYLTITSVTPREDLYLLTKAGKTANVDMFVLLFLGVIAICSLFRVFFRR